MSDTIAAYSGGALPAAVGIVRISGPRCGEILDALFLPKRGKKMTECKKNTMIYGKLFNQSERIIDLCMACRYDAPTTYTGEDMAEIFCHGSPAVVSEALKHAYWLGARPAQAGEFTKRAFLAGKMDLIGAEAAADLIYAQSGQAAENAAAQLDGAIAGPIHLIRQRVMGLLSHFYAVCDYPDEEIDEFECGRTAQILEDDAASLDMMTDGFRRSAVLREGIPVAVLGKPNAGKSSLFNALGGNERSIVTDEAGTTRDVIDQVITVEGALFRLMDTAGIRQAENQAESIGVERAKEAAEQAHAVMCVLDGSLPLEENDETVVGQGSGKPRVALINKSDLPLRFDPARLRGFDTVLHVSAKTGQGLKQVEQWLSSLAPELQGILVTSPRQADLMERAARFLHAAAASARQGMTADAFLADAEQAVHLLGEITGDTAGADIVAGIFSRFCVGK